MSNPFLLEGRSQMSQMTDSRDEFWESTVDILFRVRIVLDGPGSTRLNGEVGLEVGIEGM